MVSIIGITEKFHQYISFMSVSVVEMHELHKIKITVLKRLYKFLECKVDVPRVRIGNRQTIETLISEEALLLAKFLRDEKKTWIPRIAVF